MVTLPTATDEGVVVQEFIPEPAGPVTFQVTPCVGAAAPAVPVTVATNAKFEWRCPSPVSVPVTVMDGVAFGTNTSEAAIGNRAK